jgi:hypothetical protein
MMISDFLPLEQSTWIQKRIEGRIRSNLKDMAAALMSRRVFQLIVKLDAKEQRRLQQHTKQQQALMESHKGSNWLICRRSFIQQLLITFLEHDPSVNQATAHALDRKISKSGVGKVTSDGGKVTEIASGERGATRTPELPADVFASIEVVLGTEANKAIFPDEAFASIDTVQGNFPAEVYNLLSH